jgi:MoaA/NifB/PqqE/SkfB family radical SAM enzyme
MFTFRTKLSMVKALLTKNSPFYIQFYVSKYCHQNCKMCNIVEANSDTIPFPSDKIEKIADNLVKIGAGVVLLTGGEPFMRPDIDEIVRIFKLRGLDVRLQTAGLITRKNKISKCVEYGARDINVSIDSLDEKMSDYINGLSGSWRNAMKTIAYISRTFPAKDTICALGCVLSPYNINEIEILLDFTTKIGWWLSLVPVHITNKSKPLNFRGYDEHFKFKKSDFIKIRALIDRLKIKKKNGLKLFDSDNYLESIYSYITTNHPNWRTNNICDSPNLYFAILPDASFAPCCDYKFQNKLYVYDDDFPSIFKSKIFRNQVRNITKICSGCNFGSYPEMSLSVRSISTIAERFSLQLKAQKQGLKNMSDNQLFEIIDKIRKDNSNYYKKLNYPTREHKKWPKVPNIPKNLWNE